MTTRSDMESPPSTVAQKAHQAQDEATRVGHETRQAGSHLAQEAVGQGRQVVTETRQQARNLVGETTAQLRTQAEEQRQRAAHGLRSLGSQLESMAAAGERDSAASDIVRRGADAAQQTASWLERQEPGDIVHEVRDFARRHPGGFLAGAAVLGLLVGRLTRGITSGDQAASSGTRTDPDQGPTGSRSQASAEAPVPTETENTALPSGLDAGEGMIR